MIVIRNTDTGELQEVASTTGYGEEWAIVADPAPDGPHLWDGTALVPDLATARAAQRAIINAGRNAAQDGGADTPSGRFDSGPRSREFLNSAVTNALLANLSETAFSINWTRADNSVVTMDADATIAAGVAVAAHVDAMHQRGEVLKSRIAEAVTLAAIRAIVWTVEDEE